MWGWIFLILAGFSGVMLWVAGTVNPAAINAVPVPLGAAVLIALCAIWRVAADELPVYVAEWRNRRR